MSETTKGSRLINLLASRQLFWLLLIALVIVLSIWWVPGDGTSITDTYSTEVPGKHAFYQVIRELYSDRSVVRRSVNELIPDDASTIVFLGPARIPDEDEWQELSEFVANGGTLLYAADVRTDDFDTGPFRVSLENNWVESPDPWSEEEQSRLTFGLASSFDGTRLVWASEAQLKCPNTYREEILLLDGQGIQAVRVGYGQGRAVFVASDVVFQNRSMLNPDAQKTASRLFELAYAQPRNGPERIYFDETLNTTGTPRVLGILFTPTFRPLSLQLLLLTLLFGWWGSRRFGPAAQPKSTDRRAIVEHAQALGSMHFKVGTANHVLKSYFEYFRTVAQMPSGRIDKVANALAARSGIEQTEIERLLTETNNAIQNPALGSGTAATLIQQLASVRDRMMHFGANS